MFLFQGDGGTNPYTVYVGTALGTPLLSGQQLSAMEDERSRDGLARNIPIGCTRAVPHWHRGGARSPGDPGGAPPPCLPARPHSCPHWPHAPAHLQFTKSPRELGQSHSRREGD